MKRHTALEPFSRDHNVGLILARELSRADVGVGQKLVDIWRDEMRDHFEQEEDLLVPLATEAHAKRLVSEHRQFATFVEEVTKGNEGPELLRAAGALLDSHIRWEEREFFVEIEKSSTDAQLAELIIKTEKVELSRAASKWAPRRGELAARKKAQCDALELAHNGVSGPLWGNETEDLNCTLLSWPEGHQIEEHVNNEVDVVMAVLSGNGTVTIDGRRIDARDGTVLVIAKGSRRAISATKGPFVYLNVHKRRRKLMPISPDARPKS